MLGFTPEQNFNERVGSYPEYLVTRIRGRQQGSLYCPLKKRHMQYVREKNSRAGFAVRIERTDHPARSEKARKTQHKKFHLPCNAPATCRARGMRARWCENNTPKVTATVLPWMKNKKKKSQTLWTDATNIKKTPPLRLNAWGSIKPV